MTNIFDNVLEDLFKSALNWVLKTAGKEGETFVS